jgi:hypothetical protein
LEPYFSTNLLTAPDGLPLNGEETGSGSVSWEFGSDKCAAYIDSKSMEDLVILKLDVSEFSELSLIESGDSDGMHDC